MATKSAFFDEPATDGGASPTPNGGDKRRSHSQRSQSRARRALAAFASSHPFISQSRVCATLQIDIHVSAAPSPD